MLENAEKIRTSITPNTDTFYAVKFFEKTSKLTYQNMHLNNLGKSGAHMPFGLVFAR